MQKAGQIWMQFNTHGTDGADGLEKVGNFVINIKRKAIMY